MKKAIGFFFFIFIMFIGVVVRLDRHFFKSNKSFSIQMILSTLQSQPQWKTPPIPLEEKEHFLDILAQPFQYLDRGGQSTVFLSKDGKYVLKFYRFPSHLRPLGWVKHPFSYRFSKKREKIKEHNFEKLHVTFGSFLLAYSELKEESGLLFVHLNPTTDIYLSATLVDQLGNHYLVDLDRVAFVLQKRADGVFSTLDRLIKNNEHEKAKEHVDSLLHLITSRCQKGIRDNDAILEQNYGFSEGKAIHVDVGRLARDASVKEPKKMAEHTQKILWCLRSWIREEAPELSGYLEERLSSSL